MVQNTNLLNYILINTKWSILMIQWYKWMFNKTKHIIAFYSIQWWKLVDTLCSRIITTLLKLIPDSISICKHLIDVKLMWRVNIQLITIWFFLIWPQASCTIATTVVRNMLCNNSCPQHINLMYRSLQTIGLEMLQYFCYKVIIQVAQHVAQRVAQHFSLQHGYNRLLSR